MLDKRIKKLVETNDLVCLRDRYTKKLLGVSLTEDGLKVIANKIGKLPYYQDAKLVLEDNKLVAVGNVEKSNKTIVVPFKPIEHKDPMLVKCEILWITKARYLLTKNKRSFVNKRI